MNVGTVCQLLLIIYIYVLLLLTLHAAVVSVQGYLQVTIQINKQAKLAVVNIIVHVTLQRMI